MISYIKLKLIFLYRISNDILYKIKTDISI